MEGWRRLQLAASLLAALWGALALLALFTTLYRVTGGVVEARIALTWSTVEYRGVRIHLALLDTLPAMLFPVAAASVAVILLAAAGAWASCTGREALALFAPLASSIIAALSLAPIRGGAELAHAAVERLLAENRVETNAGVILLGEPRLIPGPAALLIEAGPLAGLLSPLNLAAYLLAAASLAALILSQQPGREKQPGLPGTAAPAGEERRGPQS